MSRFELDPQDAEPLRQRVADELHAYARVHDRHDARRALRRRLGMPRLDLAGDPRKDHLGADDACTYQRLAVPLTDGLCVDGLLVLPRRPTGRTPLVVAQHGGAGSPELATFHGGANYGGMVRVPAEAGYAVWVPRLYMPPPGPDGQERTRLDRMLRARGTTLLGVEVAKLIAALDVLTEMPEVDAQRVAMVGLSIGGQYALLCAALDRRLRVTVASNPVVHDGWVDELAPAVELVQLICPRPLQVQVGARDEVVPPTVARAVRPQAEALYTAAGAAGSFQHVEANVGHDFVDELAWPFVTHHLGAAAPRLPEVP